MQNYDEQVFSGIHWETGTLHNYFHCRNYCAPHSAKPYSEALLLGISGGITFGYFSFHYQNHDPFVALLTRNTFHPWQTILNRLNIVEEILQTSNEKKSWINLLSVLDEGIPAIVWADEFSLSYNHAQQKKDNWAIFPLLAYKYSKDKVWLADRAQVPLVVPIEELQKARGRIKKDKFRIAVLDIPDEKEIYSAVRDGINDCINLYLNPPPKGSKHNFGFLAFDRWISLLTKPKIKMSWNKEFSGHSLYCALTSTFKRIALFGQSGKNFDSERSLYGDFLKEASILLNEPKLVNVAEQFYTSASEWSRLTKQLLPNKIKLFVDTRKLMVEKHVIFRAKGQEASSRIVKINSKLQELKEQATEHFPLTLQDREEMLNQFACKILQIRDIEKKAICDLQNIMK